MSWGQDQTNSGGGGGFSEPVAWGQEDNAKNQNDDQLEAPAAWGGGADAWGAPGKSNEEESKNPATEEKKVVKEFDKNGWDDENANYTDLDAI